MTNPLIAFSEHLTTAVERAGQSTVAVHARHRFDSSGVHWKPGIIVTANHTVRRDDEIRVTLADGSTKPATLVGRDPGTDLAVLRVEGLTIPVATPLEGDPGKPGKILLAVGRMKDSVSAAFGVLSSVSAASQTWRGGKLDQVLRLDIALHPWAAGGAVTDVDGNLVGIATAALSRVSVFAIPVATIRRVTEKILAHGRIPRGYLGVGLQPIALPEHLKTELSLPAATGLIAISIEPDGPAGRAGLVLGDILVALSGRTISRPEDVQEVLDADSIGKPVKARLVRAGKITEIEIVAGERPRKG